MIAQRQVHPSREHEHRKPHLTQEEGGWVCGVYCAQAGPPDDDPGEHRRHDPPSAEPEQRAAETGEHDHDEGSEAHGRGSLRGCSTEEFRQAEYGAGARLMARETCLPARLKCLRESADMRSKKTDVTPDKPS